MVNGQKNKYILDDNIVDDRAVTAERKDADGQFVLVAIPAYNEAETIADVVAKTFRYTDHVLVVDDGSTDGTAKRAAAAGATVIEHDHNSGYGAALKTAFTEAVLLNPDILVVLDGDGQHDPDDIPRLVEAQRHDDADIVIGSRFIDGVGSRLPLYRRMGLWLVNRLTDLSTGPKVRVTDTQSGFRAYSRRVVETLAAETIDEGMCASIDILYHADSHGYEISEIETVIYYDVPNSNSQHPISHGSELLWGIGWKFGRDYPFVLTAPVWFALLVGFALGYTALGHVRSGALSTGTAPIAVLLSSVCVLMLFTGVSLSSVLDS